MGLFKPIVLFVIDECVGGRFVVDNKREDGLDFGEGFGVRVDEWVRGYDDGLVWWKLRCRENVDVQEENWEND